MPDAGVRDSKDSSSQINMATSSVGLVSPLPIIANGFREKDTDMPG
jgi:hypothetical protein